MLRPKILAGLPRDTKSRPKVDFRPNQFDKQVYNNGYRVWWSRAIQCPCRGNDQTDQASPVCNLCNGKGYYYINPDKQATIDGVDVAGNEIEVNDAEDAIGIQAIITSTTVDPQIYERFGQWLFGTAKATTNRYNRIGWKDRLTARDSTMSFGQLITADGNNEIIVTGLRAKNGLWSPVVNVNVLRTVATEFVQEEDYAITENGTIQWLKNTPASGTVLSIHAEFRPIWIVQDHVYAVRDTMIARKTKPGSLADQHTQLPIHAVVKLDFLADD